MDRETLSMLTVAQVADRLGVCRSLVYSWVDAGQLPHYRMGAAGKRGGIRIEEADLEAFLATKRVEGCKMFVEPSPSSSRLRHLSL